GFFPQDREWYLLFLSIFVTFFLYLTRAYKGDMTVFMLTSVTMMMVFKNGEIDDVFIYGIDRTFMTIFGIAIFTLIGIFIWPVKTKDGTLDIAEKLLSIQSELYRHRDDTEEKRKALYQKLQEEEKLLETSVINSGADELSLSIEQRNSIMQNAKQINELLMLLSYNDEVHFADEYSKYINNFDSANEEISELFSALQHSIKEGKEIDIPSAWKAIYHVEEIKELSHLDRAVLAATMADIEKIHKELRDFAEKFNAIISPYPTYFKLANVPNPSSFNWFDVEDMKGALISFIIFWVTTIFWITVNPPAGFLIVTLATALSVLTTFSPLKPSLLIIIFTFSFLFAAAMYILVLPNIYYGWELGLFIFIYSFIGFYFITPKISIFFLLGMAVLGLNNPMYYNFNLFLLILFVFYLFLFVLLLFYYIPFSTKPEHLFLTMKKRFFTLSSKLLRRGYNLNRHKGTFIGAADAKYSYNHLMNTVKKMQLWASKIDTNYFDMIDQKQLLAFTKECETLAYLLQIVYRKDKQVIDNPLIRAYVAENNGEPLANLFTQYAEGKEVKEIDPLWRDEQQIIETIEEKLKYFLSTMKSDQYSQKEIVEFYENISLRRNVWLSLFSCQNMMEALDFKVLKRSRF
ncbi:MAG: FUSC family protein, partial [Campylobacterota bacterium]|nr:FUSC family protein [Campylobacterota bacterium]